MPALILEEQGLQSLQAMDNSESCNPKDLPPVEGSTDILKEEVTQEQAPQILKRHQFSQSPQVTFSKRDLLIAGALGATLIGAYRAVRYYGRSMRKKRVVITGGSRGLGFALAEQYAQQGARVFICARDQNELNEAQKKLAKFGTEVQICACDITDSGEVKQFVQKVMDHFGGLDILVNNAGVIEVGPFDSFSLDTFYKVIDVNLLGMIRIIQDFLPHLSRGSQVINISSLGGAVAVPHMLPYTVSKFGSLGFSLGLDAELSPRGISVTTVLPGLMRTGSFVHANFRGNSQKEFNWFALAATLPVISISARNAARQIISAGQSRKRFAVVGPQAKAIRFLYQVFPETMLGLMRFAIRLLPATPKAGNQDAVLGSQLRKDLQKGGITRLGDQAGDELNENFAA